MRTLLILIGMGSGCDYVLRIDHVDPVRDSSADGARDMSTTGDGASYDCTLGAGTLETIDGTFEDPVERADKRELFVQKIVNGDRDLYVAIRDTGGSYGTPTRSVVLSSGNNDVDPTLTLGGNTIMFQSTRNGSLGVFEAIRNTLGEAFSMPVQVPIDGQCVGIDISPDGNALFAGDGTGNLQILTRNGNAFDTPAVIGAGIYDPSVAGDGLTVYYSRGGTVYRQMRASTGDMFGGELLIDMGDEPQISEDGRTLIFRTPAGLMRRECE